MSRPPGELVAAFAREAQSPNGEFAAQLELAHLLTHRTEYTPAAVATVLQGLEDLALSPAPTRSRSLATLLIATPGSNNAAQPLGGIFPRLAHIYDRSTDPLVRVSALSAMGQLADRRESTAFLERVARLEPPNGLAGDAVASLLVMGDEGRAALKRLNESHAVRDPEVRQDLQTIARNGYRVP